MSVSLPLPEHLAARAQRRSWFTRADAEDVLSWVEDTGRRFLGMDGAQKVDDEAWTLLAEPQLDLSRQTDNFEAIRMGRMFLAEFDEDGRMFDPVWQERTQ